MNEIYYFVRNNKNEPIGVVYATKFPGIDFAYISGSLCHTKLDKFDKDFAVDMARNRTTAMAFKNRSCKLPHSLQKEVIHMMDRAKRYFRTEKVMVPEFLSNTDLHLR